MRFYGRHGSIPVEWIDGFRNEERAPNVRYTGRPADLGPVGPGGPQATVHTRESAMSPDHRSNRRIPVW